MQGEQLVGQGTPGKPGQDDEKRKQQKNDESPRRRHLQEFILVVSDRQGALQGEVEGRALIRLALGPDVAAVTADDAVDGG